MARRSSAVMERAAAQATNGKAQHQPFDPGDEEDEEEAGDSANIGRVTVDGRDARIVQDELPIEDDETLDSALKFLDDAKQSYDSAVAYAKEAIGERRKMQDRLASAVDRTIAAKERERNPELAF